MNSFSWDCLSAKALQATRGARDVHLNSFSYQKNSLLHILLPFQPALLMRFLCLPQFRENFCGFFWQSLLEKEKSWQVLSIRLIFWNSLDRSHRWSRSWPICKILLILKLSTFAFFYIGTMRSARRNHVTRHAADIPEKRKFSPTWLALCLWRRRRSMHLIKLRSCDCRFLTWRFARWSIYVSFKINAARCLLRSFVSF